jgi:hypothetical protein
MIIEAWEFDDEVDEVDLWVECELFGSCRSQKTRDFKGAW